MTEDLFILVLAGTAREQRKSIRAARLIAEIGNGMDGVKTELVDPKDYNFPGDGNDPEGKDPRYSELTARADAFFIVTPEYNHSFPGSLKRMLDSELKNYIHKPVALAGVSDGNWGGVRAVEALVGTVREMGLAVTFTDVYFPKIHEQIDENGNLLNDYYKTSIPKAYKELIWMAQTLKHGREHIQPIE
ncbi:NAD(P)H-dependent oxidoreductase [Candidatus Saccharibacteria bacterium]|nr:NAD(P)H-dependent oxidoreductase [Candidatus Saccharibacteria bacterium]